MSRKILLIVTVLELSGIMGPVQADDLRVRDIPLPEEATDVSYMKRRGDVRFHVTSDFKTAGNFYAKTLVEQKWAKSGKDNLQRNFWVQTFAKDKLSLEVRVDSRGEGSEVRLTAGYKVCVTPTSIRSHDDTPMAKIFHLLLTLIAGPSPFSISAAPLQSRVERPESRAKQNARGECEFLALGSGRSSLDRPAHPLRLNKAMALTLIASGHSISMNERWLRVSVGWTNPVGRLIPRQVAYLKEENRILRARLPERLVEMEIVQYLQNQRESEVSSLVGEND